ncbi:MAG: RHS repeat-associated core domain-containing protein, partial [Solirubrobacterales bacterium]
KIEDTYGYDGNGLRQSETISGTTNHLVWDTAESLPLLLYDGTRYYVYGPEGLPIEQIASETPTYLHHDQQGSTRLLTSQAGTVSGSYAFTPYGQTEAHTGTATTPLGYGAQYTSLDTGLIYLRARVYDPATAQFMSVDPLVAKTGETYGYAGADPVNAGDPGGMQIGTPYQPTPSAQLPPWVPNPPIVYGQWWMASDGNEYRSVDRWERIENWHWEHQWVWPGVWMTVKVVDNVWEGWVRHWECRRTTLPRPVYPPPSTHSTIPRPVYPPLP